MEPLDFRMLRLLAVLGAAAVAAGVSLAPEQVHIAYNNNVDDMAVTWVTPV